MIKTDHRPSEQAGERDLSVEDVRMALDTAARAREAHAQVLVRDFAPAA